MKYLEFDVKNMAITRSSGDKTTLISGAVNYFGLHFTFDDEFASIPGAKAVEFYKNRNKIRIDLVDNACAIPNELLTDKTAFEIRVISGNTIGTQWQSISITESGVITPEEPEEELPETMEYVKTFTGDEAAPLLRATTNGLEYSKDGELWQSGVSGVPEVQKTKEPIKYVRTYGDWIPLEEEIGGIAEVKVDGTALTPTDGVVDIDLSAYAKTEDVADTYAEKSTVEVLQTLQGTASQLTALDYSETDTTEIVTKINEIIGVLQARGIATE